MAKLKSAFPNRKKKPVCRQSDTFPCGYSCKNQYYVNKAGQSKETQCKKLLGGQAKTLMEWQKLQAERIEVANKNRDKAGLKPVVVTPSLSIDRAKTQELIKQKVRRSKPQQEAVKPAQKEAIAAKLPHELTLPQFLEQEKSQLIKKYPKSVNNEAALSANAERAKTKWTESLKAKAKESRLSDEVIDSFVDAYGQQALTSTFRGQTEKGVQGWIPKDIRDSADGERAKDAEREALRQKSSNTARIASMTPFAYLKDQFDDKTARLFSRYAERVDGAWIDRRSGKPWGEKTAKQWEISSALRRLDESYAKMGKNPPEFPNRPRAKTGSKAIASPTKQAWEMTSEEYGKTKYQQAIANAIRSEQSDVDSGFGGKDFAQKAKARIERLKALQGKSYSDAVKGYNEIYPGDLSHELEMKHVGEVQKAIKDGKNVPPSVKSALSQTRLQSGDLDKAIASPSKPANKPTQEAATNDAPKRSRSEVSKVFTNAMGEGKAISQSELEKIKGEYPDLLESYKKVLQGRKKAGRLTGEQIKQLDELMPPPSTETGQTPSTKTQTENSNVYKVNPSKEFTEASKLMSQPIRDKWKPKDYKDKISEVMGIAGGLLKEEVEEAVKQGMSGSYSSQKEFKDFLEKYSHPGMKAIFDLFDQMNTRIESSPLSADEYQRYTAYKKLKDQVPLMQDAYDKAHTPMEIDMRRYRMEKNYPGVKDDGIDLLKKARLDRAKSEWDAVSSDFDRITGLMDERQKTMRDKLNALAKRVINKGKKTRATATKKAKPSPQTPDNFSEPPSLARANQARALRRKPQIRYTFR